MSATAPIAIKIQDPWSRVLHKHLSDCPGASKSQIWASILKDQEKTVAQIRQAKNELWAYNFQFTKITLFLFGGQVFFNFYLYFNF